MNENYNQPILVVEDNDEDFEITLRVFKKNEILNPVYRCVDGDDALDFLYHRGKYANEQNSPTPSLIILDLNLPGLDGKEVLSVIKQDENLKYIPTVVFTTSSAPNDIKKCYMAGANACLLKQIDYIEFIESIKIFKEFWLKIVILPKKNE